MRRTARRWGRSLAGAAALTVAVSLLSTARAQTAPGPPPATATARPRPDSIKTPLATFVVDTARHAAVVTPAPTDIVTRQLGLRIGVAIVVLSLTTLLLYNVRSR